MKIFLDTNILLKAFAKYLTKSNSSQYLNSKYQLYTFEKCKSECYMAFRGVGGKKPDEGRGDWASRHLRKDIYPAQLSKIASKYFDGDTAYASYSINHIEEEYFSLDESMIKYITEKEHIKFYEYNNKIRELYNEKNKFDSLINEFETFLEINNVKVLYYFQIFTLDNTQNVIHFNEFCKNTVIPSEDLEIIYSALIEKVDIFLTIDKKLKKLLASLGQNLPLHYSRVILEDEFENFIKQNNKKSNKNEETNNLP